MPEIPEKQSDWLRAIDTREVYEDAGLSTVGKDVSSSVSDDSDCLPEFEAWLGEVHHHVAYGDSSRALTEFSQSQLPDIVKDRLRQSIMSGAVFNDVEAISSDELLDFRQTLADGLTEDNWSLDELAGELSNRFDVSEDKAETIARTETQSIVNHAAEDAYEELSERRDEEFEFKWVGSDDRRTTEACTWLLEQTNPDHGGNPVSLEELKELIQEAPEHDPELPDTMAREFTPHINCRKRYVRHVE